MLTRPGCRLGWAVALSLASLTWLAPVQGASGDAQSAKTPTRVFRVGSKKFTENVVLGELATLLIRSTGAEAQHVDELGGTRLLWNALLAGEIDIYPEYTGTLANEILGDAALTDISRLREALRQHQVDISQPLGFNNTYALGMLESLAARLQVRTISDLAGQADLKFGFSNEFMQREDGWPGLQRRYGLNPLSVAGLDHDLAYRGIESDAIHVMDMYSTDAEIELYRMRVLQDDLQYFPDYQAVYVYRVDMRPERNVLAAVRQLEGGIDQDSMIAMNAAAKLEKQPARLVAARFLQAELGIVSDVEIAGRWSKLAQYTVGHLFLVGTSLVPAIVVAIVLGVLAWKLPAVGHAVLATVGVIQTIPALALLVLLIPLLGIGWKPAVMALFLYSLLPIVRATHQGLSGIPTQLTESALALGLPATTRFWRIELPLALPAIASGVKVAAVLNVGFATLGALIAAGGYGDPILTGIRLDDTGLILLGAIPSALLAILFQLSFEWLERRIVPRGLRLTRDQG